MDTSAASNPNQDETNVDLVGSNQFGDDTNTQIAIPITERDQRAENRAVNLDLAEIEEEAQAQAPQCPPGFEFNPDTDQCEQTQTAAPICPGDTFNPATDQCEILIDIGGSPICIGGEFNPDTDQCERTVTRPPT
jgi:hypothetical protein